MKIGIQGASGRTGSLIAQYISKSGDLKLVGAFVAPDAAELGAELRETSLRYETLNVKSLSSLDVLIDVSSPEGLAASAALLHDLPKPLLAMTTGFPEEVRASLERLSKRVPICIASNTSVGIATLLSVLPMVKDALGEDYDIEISEIHHGGKKDAPSGTALSLLRAVGSEESLVSDRTRRKGARPKGEIGVHSLRGGGVFGTHSVLFLGEDEVIEIKHEALSRGAFAKGALTLVRRLANSPPGLYSPRELISPRG